MTVSSTTVKNSYSGDGSNDTFVYGFKIFASSDLQVIIRSATGTETTKTLTTDYTVTGVGTASGGNVVFEAAAIPTATETVVLIRNVPQTQAIDYIANDPFPAETHEEGLDRATMTIQQMQEEINRSIKLSKTNTMTSTEFTVAAADRANKILAFDSTGEISVTQELGTYKGTDTTVTTEAYVQRDIVKSTSAAQLNNVYICVGDSVVGDLLTDTDHFDLLVDAYSAASSAAAAASSATDAEQIKFTTTASAVNELTVVNSAAGNAPEISSTGGDTDIDLKITPKGSGKIVLDGISFPNADGTANQALVTDGSGVLSFASVTGRTGTVDWCTTAKTAPFTGVSGKGYFVNTTCGAVTVTLPATPTAGDIISIKDYARTAGTNNISFCRNGSKMDGICDSGSINTNGDSTTLIYVDGTKGWTSILDSTTNNYGTQYISATGGTVLTCGDYKIHTFTSDGCFAVSCAGNPVGSDKVSYLVVAGGGGGSTGWGSNGGGGGGAGGFREGKCSSDPYTESPLDSGTALTVSVQSYPITVGAGGSAANGPAGRSASGSVSTFSTITSTGGGAGGAGTASPGPKDGAAGGSGGGKAGGDGPGSNQSAGLGNQPPVSPAQGFDGGGGQPPGSSGDREGFGGGGATAEGGLGAAAEGVSGTGGAGATTSINGTPTARAGGGAGGAGSGGSSGAAGAGGGGSGGFGSPANNGNDGTANTGGGGGGGANGPASNGNSGGSGVVIIRYKYQN
jgi:hypothetical protein